MFVYQLYSLLNKENLLFFLKGEFQMHYLRSIDTWFGSAAVSSAGICAMS